MYTNNVTTVGQNGVAVPVVKHILFALSTCCHDQCILLLLLLNDHSSSDVSVLYSWEFHIYTQYTDLCIYRSANNLHHLHFLVEIEESKQAEKQRWTVRLMNEQSWVSELVVLHNSMIILTLIHYYLLIVHTSVYTVVIDEFHTQHNRLLYTSHSSSIIYTIEPLQ